MFRVVVCAVTMLGIGSWAARAETITFHAISNNSAVNVATGEAQLSVEVTSIAGGARFLFQNSGPNASIITAIGFSDPLPLLFGTPGNGTHFTDSGVDFVVGGAGFPDIGQLDYVIEANRTNGPGGVQNGINVGEELQIDLSFAGSGIDFDDVLDALRDGGLQIGLHVQAFSNQGSEKFLNNPLPSDPTPAPVPLPSVFASAVVLLGAVGMAKLRSRPRRV